ncbi:conserved hypothetical protein [Leishmania major strain Friedlin]|uniref:Uncharacterized protein n=1 Tax=Leishmania major TaxID=5664 RepID=Q9NF93_LEIMA|nr:conserved hypothetical protein [Leishmania major strain Friedlin]CAC22646.1 conserved hypothetical protein [Leishmania major strain Friedlin]CAG9567819.1 COPI_associated_protein_-_putative [Leishmania major strain Friedlin]|eukprot:XP_888613.1 conserved hypothetical protein [Leishmania major strain Friedlin]
MHRKGERALKRQSAQAVVTKTFETAFGKEQACYGESRAGRGPIPSCLSSVWERRLPPLPRTILSRYASHALACAAARCVCVCVCVCVYVCVCVCVCVSVPLMSACCIHHHHHHHHHRPPFPFPFLCSFLFTYICSSLTHTHTHTHTQSVCVCVVSCVRVQWVSLAPPFRSSPRSMLSVSPTLAHRDAASACIWCMYIYIYVCICVCMT